MRRICSKMILCSFAEISPFQIHSSVDLYHNHSMFVIKKHSNCKGRKNYNDQSKYRRRRKIKHFFCYSSINLLFHILLHWKKKKSNIPVRYNLSILHSSNPFNFMAVDCNFLHRAGILIKTSPFYSYPASILKTSSQGRCLGIWFHNPTFKGSLF